MSLRRPIRALLAALACFAAMAALAAPAGAAGNLPSGFQETTVISGLQEPATFRFAPNGKVFVAEKPGRILVYDNIDDPTPTLFADLRTNVYDKDDHGILGMTIDPQFPTRPYVYVLYAYNHILGDPAPPPKWNESPTPEGDSCPLPPPPANNGASGCPVSGRLVRLTAEGDHAQPTSANPLEKLLVEDWCEQSSTHSIGDLEFGPEGALYASGGDGAEYGTPDYGQLGWPHKNQCNDPPGGEDLDSKTNAEGGSLRSQDVLTPATLADPTGLDGTVIRVDPDTGQAFPGNPMATSLDANERRIVAFGLRNPFRFALNPESDEVYVSHVGNGAWEEIDRFAGVPTQAYNSGWPCYEGAETDSGFDYRGLTLCETLYHTPGSNSYPFFAYSHTAGLTADDTAAGLCPYNIGSAVSGSDFYDGDTFPDAYENAFFVADSVRGCIYVMFAGEDGRPDPSTTMPFLTQGGLYPGVDIHVGPDGNLYYSQLFSTVGGNEFGLGAIHRIAYFSGNQPPVAELTATPEWAVGQLSAQFDATGSTDADKEALTYEWDLDGDGIYDQTPGQNGKQNAVFSDSQNHTVAVRVKDPHGASSIARVTVFPGDTPPTPTILDPAESSTEAGVGELKWAVGEPIDFDGQAVDTEDGGELASTKLEWITRLYHCPGGASACHAHPLQAYPTVASGTLIPPEHDYPAHLELRLTATDSRGLSASRVLLLYPRTVTLDFATQPPGLPLTAGLINGPAPFTVTAIEGSTVGMAAPEKGRLGSSEYVFGGWSDGGGRAHTIVADASGKYTATYVPASLPPKETPKEKPPGNPEGPIVRTATLGKHPPRRTRSRTARFTFSGSHSEPGFECSLDKGRYRPCTSPRVYRHVNLGGHLFRVRVTGAANAPAVFRWTALAPKPRHR